MAVVSKTQSTTLNKAQEFGLDLMQTFDHVDSDLRGKLAAYVLRMETAVVRLDGNVALWKESSEGKTIMVNQLSHSMEREEQRVAELREDKKRLLEEGDRLRKENEALRAELDARGIQAKTQVVQLSQRRIFHTQGWFWATTTQSWVPHRDVPDASRGPKPQNPHPRAADWQRKSELRAAATSTQ